MRDAPLRVGRIPSETAADLVVDSASRHGAQRFDSHRARVAVARAGVTAEEKPLVGGHRKLGGAPEAEVLWVVRAAKGRQRRVEDFRGGPAPLLPRGGDVPRDLLREPRGVGLDVLAARRPQLRDALEQLDPAGLAPARVRREVCAAEERLEFRRQKNVERPAALAGHRLDGGHVDFIDVGPLFAVQLHADEFLVHHGRHFRAGEALALHHVAPMAGRVADREQQRLVLLLRRLESLVPPGPPIDGIVLMLEQIRAFLGGETIRAHRKTMIAKTRADSPTAPQPPDAMSTAPATMSAPPAAARQEIVSPRNTAASAIAKTTLNLSTGATREAGPTRNAR